MTDQPGHGFTPDTHMDRILDWHRGHLTRRTNCVICVWITEAEAKARTEQPRPEAPADEK